MEFMIKIKLGLVAISMANVKEQETECSENDKIPFPALAII